MNLSRRTFGLGLIATLAAPAIIRTPGVLMPVKRRVWYICCDFGLKPAYTLIAIRGINQSGEDITQLAEPICWVPDTHSALTEMQLDAALSEIRALTASAARRVMA